MTGLEPAAAQSEKVSGRPFRSQPASEGGTPRAACSD